MIKWCQRKVDAIENGSLQRYLMLMFAVVLLAAGWPLFEMSQLGGQKTTHSN